MLDLGWSEILVIGVAALIVVGPKDLPRMLRTLGRYTARARSIAREFQRSMDDAARQADLDELKDVKKSLDDVRAIQTDTKRAISQSFSDSPKKPEAKAPAPKAEKPATAKAETPAQPNAEAPAKTESEPGSAGGA